MKNSEKYQKAFNFFKQSYSYKMGGSQTVILPNGKKHFFDDRTYYSGKGSKYNNAIKHDDLGEIKVSRKEYSAFLQHLKSSEKAKQKRILEQQQKQDLFKQCHEKGIYPTNNNYIVLSDNEVYSNTFNAKKLAKTLNISIKDAELLNSAGKTYVFAKQLNSDTVLELYHPSLDCNHISIYFKEATAERMAKFNANEWQNQPFANLVGQTTNTNHFVC